MIITINDKGRLIADRIAAVMPHDICSTTVLADRWDTEREIIFIGALGICVRSIAPYVKNKHTDPAVVCIDTMGKQVISVLSGHIGGANNLTRRLADILGATPVITTQSDMQGLWALDTLAKEYGWAESFEGEGMNEEIALFVNGEPTALYVDDCCRNDSGAQHLLDTVPEHVSIVSDPYDITAERFRLAIIVSPMEHFIDIDVRLVQYIPQCLHVGIGLAHQAEPAEMILSEILNALSMNGIYLESIIDFNTIDLKADEPVVRLLQEDGMKVNFYTAEELKVIDVPNPSTTVSKHVGTPSVCEAAAIKASLPCPLPLRGKGVDTLFTPKIKGEKWTVATAIHLPSSQPSPLGGNEGGLNEGGFIDIVGAGPGDPDLISVRGRRLLEQADLILYAGSLVPKELTYCHKSGAVVRSSADMALEEQFALMKEFYDKGMRVVRLHTGDPCIYGAIQEQMAFFDEYGMEYHITPGISSFLAAAAELQSQFTIPERCQTIILTRGEGRTPMPEKEKLHMLASHQSTMCIFLSASIVDDVQQQLLDGGYPPETPVAACYKLTWKDQRIYRGQLKDLAYIIKENNLSLTTMIVVGDAIDNRHGLSKLYDKHFTHLFRKSVDDQ